VQKAGKDHAAVFIEAHTHNDELETYFTVVLGVGASREDRHTTFSCRFGYLESIDGNACSLMDVPSTYTDPFMGKKLTREQALKSTKLESVWTIVDYLVLSDMVLHDFFHHANKSKLKALLRLYK
jgi:hypothetical protein